MTARGIDFASLVVLGHLLTPADFGLVAIAMSVIMISEAVIDMPVIQVLVRLPHMGREHLDTAFTLILIRGSVVASILVLSAWPVSRLYNDDRLIALVCALALAPLVRSVGSVRVAEYSRRLDFRREVAVEIVGKSCQFLVSTCLAWWTRSYWSLAAGTIATPFASAVVSFVLAPYRPALSLARWREFAGFVGWTAAAQAISALNWQLDQLVLGRFVSRTALGRFSMASSIAVLPTQVIVLQVLSPLMAAFSMIRGDRMRLAAAYRNSATMVVAAGAPMLIGLGIIAEPAIRLLLGEQWVGAAPLLRWLALAMIPSLFTGPLPPLAMAAGRTDIFLLLSAIEFVLKVPATFVGAFYYGLPGVLVSRLAIAMTMAFCSMFAVRSLIALPIRIQMFGAWRPILSCIVMSLAILPLQSWLARYHDYIPPIASLATIVGVGAATYGFSLLFLWYMAGFPEGFESKVLGIIGLGGLQTPPTYDRKELS